MKYAKLFAKGKLHYLSIIRQTNSLVHHLEHLCEHPGFLHRLPHQVVTLVHFWFFLLFPLWLLLLVFAQLFHLSLQSAVGQSATTSLSRQPGWTGWLSLPAL